MGGTILANTIEKSVKYPIGSDVKIVDCNGRNPIVGEVIARTLYSVIIEHNGVQIMASTSLCERIENEFD